MAAAPAGSGLSFTGVSSADGPERRGYVGRVLPGRRAATRGEVRARRRPVRRPMRSVRVWGSGPGTAPCAGAPPVRVVGSRRRQYVEELQWLDRVGEVAQLVPRHPSVLLELLDLVLFQSARADFGCRGEQAQEEGFLSGEIHAVPTRLSRNDDGAFADGGVPESDLLVQLPAGRSERVLICLDAAARPLPDVVPGCGIAPAQQQDPLVGSNAHDTYGGAGDSMRHNAPGPATGSGARAPTPHSPGNRPRFSARWECLHRGGAPDAGHATEGPVPRGTGP